MVVNFSSLTRDVGCGLLALQLTACAPSDVGDDGTGSTQPVSQVTATASVDKGRDAVTAAPAGNLADAVDARADKSAKSVKPGGGSASAPGAGDRYELRLLRNLAAYRDPIRLQSIGNAGYPTLSAVVYRLDGDGDGDAQPLKPTVVCRTAIVCEHRGSVKTPDGVPNYLLTLDSPSIAYLKAGEQGIEVAPASTAFPTDVVVTLTLAIGNQPPIARSIRFVARQ